MFPNKLNILYIYYKLCIFTILIIYFRINMKLWGCFPIIDNFFVPLNEGKSLPK